MLWWAGTAAHFLLTSRWLNRLNTTVSRDERWFQAMVAGTGSLSVALHLLSALGSLTLWSVVGLLFLVHAAAAWMLRGRPSQGESPLKTIDDGRAITKVLELAATVTLVAITIQWSVAALRTAEVSGSDAAHYHVPNAVNLALGAGLFDLPATSHLYPMGSSMLAAWFILPVQTPLLTDLVMVLPFLLLVAAAGWIFRQMTSLSGLAWSTWMLLALFSTPLFRTASLMSADLLFAASTVAFAAAVLAPVMRRQVTPMDVWLVALSLGLLLGSKVTGVVAAGLLAIPAMLSLIILKARGLLTIAAHPWVRTIAGAALAVIGAGGIWLVRNWWVWGSPVAPNGVTFLGVTLFPGLPYEPTTYLSVLGDLTEKPEYRLWDRTEHFIDLWLSGWYLPGLLATAFIPIDFLLARRRKTDTAVRLWGLVVISGTGALLAWFLIGAPWTSLEWTDGFSLRYALPWLVLLPLSAWTALFPAAFPWYRHPTIAAIAGLAMAAGSIAILAGQQAPAFPPLPTLAVVFVSVLIVAAPYALQLVSRPWRWLLIGGVALRAAYLLALWTMQGDALAQESRLAAIAGGPRTKGEQVYDAALAFEANAATSCDAQGRRFFVTNRFDEAGALQGPRLRNQVFYAGRDVKVTANVRPPMGACDYLITEQAIIDTDKGAMLHAGLNPSGRLVPVATVGDVLLLVHR